MVDWSSPIEIAFDAAVFEKSIFVLFGIYCWEICLTSHFDFSIMTGQRTFRLPLVSYFLTRYGLLFALIGLVISLSITYEINCQALYKFIQWAGNTAIAAASTCLLFRTLAIWENKYVVMIPLSILSLGQWGLLYYGVTTVAAEWSPQAAACAVTSASATVLNIIFFYTMAFDFIVLCTTVVGLLMTGGRSGVWKLLFVDGVVYFLVTFTANAFPAILNLLNLNPAMNVIAAVPACVVSTIAATRAVVRLQEFRNQDVYIHSATAVSTRIGAGSGGKGRTGPLFASEGMQVTMDTFVKHEESESPIMNDVKSHLDLERGESGWESDRRT